MADSKQLRKILTLLIIPGILIFALLIALYLFYSSTDKQGVVTGVSDRTQMELAKCDQYAEKYKWEISRKRSCSEFIQRWCDLLKRNYALREKKMIAAQDLGLRLPVLEQTLDPAYPIDCYPQWWLTEGELYESNPKPFSEYQNFTEYSPKYFAHKDAIGDLQFPEMYEIEKKYSRNDQKLLKRALTAAYKYADINVAIQDGYAIQPSFNRSMGIHLSNLALFDETMNIDEPEFLTYIKSRWNNSYVLAQIRIYSNQKQ